MLGPIKAALRIPEKDLGRLFVAERTGDEERFVLDSLGGNENDSNAACWGTRIRVPVDDESFWRWVEPFSDKFMVLVRVEECSRKRFKRSDLLSCLQRRDSGLGSENNATAVRVGK